ncbi:hypothetical protein PUS82_00475 [Cytobacillus firmus]|uniref:hypothetical protein n=1 Tax=Cytobacillus firmus TaxID=1399 RepID=UPI00237BBED3|nr:hypothetical protein [Cytobacillus firmus]MDD9309806.1 hypothetical protein [Cytobacillus firmus]
MELNKALKLYQITKRNKELAEETVDRKVKELYPNLHRASSSVRDKEKDVIKKIQVSYGLHFHKAAYEKAEQALIDAYREESQIEDPSLVKRVVGLGLEKQGFPIQF